MSVIAPCPHCGLMHERVPSDALYVTALQRCLNALKAALRAEASGQPALSDVEAAAQAVLEAIVAGRAARAEEIVALLAPRFDVVATRNAIHRLIDTRVLRVTLDWRLVPGASRDVDSGHKIG